VDHEEAGAAMTRRGNGIIALAAVALSVVGFVAAGGAGVAEHPAVAGGTAVSGTWLCPHGGGAGWLATIAIANPGTQPVQARLTSLGADRADDPISVTVPAGHEILQSVPAGSRESSTYVETFGGWAAAGWMVRARRSATGLGAEPCTPEGGSTWLVTGQSTERGESSFLVVMNPYASRATIDVTLFSPNRAPLRSAQLTTIVIPPLRSVALPLNAVEGETTVGAAVDAKIGRVATAALGVTESGGVRSVLAVPAAGTDWYLPAGGGAEQSALSVFAPGEDNVIFDATLLSGETQRAAGDLNAQEQDGSSARPYPVLTSGASSIDVATSNGIPIVPAVRTAGRGDDDAGTTGVVAPAPAWVVTPTAGGGPSLPGLVIANPGDADLRVVLRLLTPGSTAVADRTMVVPARSAVGAPRGFLAESPQASVLVTSEGGDVVAAGSSTSGGTEGLLLFAVAAGIAIPAAP
jgi:hypothetical protein